MAQAYLTIRRSNYNAWVPQTNKVHNEFILDLFNSVKGLAEHKDAVKKFDQAVSQPQKDLFASALIQVRKYYAKWADSKSIVKDWDGFLTLLDGIVESPPPFYKSERNGVTIGEPIGVPLYLILDLVSNTSAAYSLFTEPTFNKPLKDLLDSWGTYLADPDRGSNALLTDEYWFSKEGLAVLESGLGKWDFWQTYKVDSSTKPGPYYKSWDSFFTREFKDKALRPIQPGFVTNACECTVLRTAKDVQINDTFWLKEQNYSIYDILGGSEKGSLAGEYADRFQGGSVYQAFLSPADYHCWHSPITGNIVASKLLEGGYYAVLPDDGAPPYDPDLEPGDPHGALIRSQPWLSVSSTRAVYIIQPTDSDLHLKWVAFIAIGMAEVSTCDITKASGTVSAGDEIGKFHFGGSSHTLLLKPEDGYEVVFQDVYETPIRPGQHRWINSGIAQVRKIPK
ncbi:phosphatidylserine decarboxylase-domain-containing protein [Boletus coccyginus]|nr:phosphatidylserine decarboxylase-domain-containing protein [Boletus coccyginus]